MQNTSLIEKIQNLPPETANEVEDFVDFLTEKQANQKTNGERNSATETFNLSERGISPNEASDQRAALASFTEDWELPEMEIYDKL